MTKKTHTNIQNWATEASNSVKCTEFHGESDGTSAGPPKTFQKHKKNNQTHKKSIL